MSLAQLNRSNCGSESLLTDRAYRGRRRDDRIPRRAPAPQITMEASQPFSISFGEGRFWFEHEPPMWIMPLLINVCELGDLPSDWDSYGALSIDPEIAASAVNLLLNIMSEDDAMPAVVPTSHGGVVLEWHDGGIDLEIDVRSPSSIHVYFEDDGSEEEFVDVDADIIQEKLNILRGRLRFNSGIG